ncbi:MAG: hypothetical protein RSE62_03680 [Citrobacter sp.]
MAEWLRSQTTKLIQHNHRLAEIGNYTLGQFVCFLDEVQMVEAQNRIEFVMDVSVAASSVAGGDGKFLEAHLEKLQYAAQGE